MVFGITGMSCLFVFYLKSIIYIKPVRPKESHFFSQTFWRFYRLFGIAAYSYKNGYVFTQWGDFFFLWPFKLPTFYCWLCIIRKPLPNILQFLLFLAICASCVAAVAYDLIQLEYLRRLQQSSLIIIFYFKGYSNSSKFFVNKVRVNCHQFLYFYNLVDVLLAYLRHSPKQMIGTLLDHIFWLRHWIFWF